MNLKKAFKTLFNAIEAGIVALLICVGMSPIEDY
jgi:hypothetical protein